MVTAAWSWKRKLLFGLMTTFLFIGLLEATLRVVLREAGKATIPVQGVQDHIQGGMAFDEVLGWKWRILPDPTVGLNSVGFRYSEVSPDRVSGSFRAFTVGDSQTYGAGVEPSETYTAFAEVALRAAVGNAPPIEVINAGISGYTSLQTLKLTETRLLSYHPDAIIMDNRTFDSPRAEAAEPPAERWMGLNRILFDSRIAYVLRVMVDRTSANQPRRMKGNAPNVPTDKLVFGNHDRLLELGKQRGFTAVFLDYPFWDKAQNRIVCLAPSGELPPGGLVSKVCEALQQSGLEPSTLFLDNNHLTVRGNEIVGRTLAETLQGLLSRRSPAL